jgi:hypothetical protein
MFGRAGGVLSVVDVGVAEDVTLSPEHANATLVKRASAIGRKNFVLANEAEPEAIPSLIKGKTSARLDQTSLGLTCHPKYTYESGKAPTKFCLDSRVQVPVQGHYRNQAVDRAILVIDFQLTFP